LLPFQTLLPLQRVSVAIEHIVCGVYIQYNMINVSYILYTGRVCICVVEETVYI